MGNIGKGMGGHHGPDAGKYEWLTPKELVQSLGEFDLDPCAPVVRPWETARRYWTIEDDGLLMEWIGRVWLNPPYGKYLNDWMGKMAVHREGIALIFARTDTLTFHKYVFPVADSMLFMRGRVNFCNVDGSKGEFNGGAPSVLIAYGERNVEALEESGIAGKHVLINLVPVIVVGMSASWKVIVQIALVKLGREAELERIYRMVEVVSPEKVQRNQWYREKVRQVLQNYFVRVSKGKWTVKN